MKKFILSLLFLGSVIFADSLTLDHVVGVKYDKMGRYIGSTHPTAIVAYNLTSKGTNTIFFMCSGSSVGSVAVSRGSGTVRIPGDITGCYPPSFSVQFGF